MKYNNATCNAINLRINIFAVSGRSSLAENWKQQTEKDKDTRVYHKIINSRKHDVVWKKQTWY